MNPTYDFSGQVALVTGAGAGMGLDTARAFAASGAAVVLADVNEVALRAATDELTAVGHRALGVACDVADEDQVAALVERTVAEFGRLDMAFNNAGIMIPPSDAADEPAEHFDRVTAVNLRGVWTCMKHELRHMRAQGSGAIVNCSSLAGLVGGPGRASYSATKQRRHRPDEERRARLRPHRASASTPSARGRSRLRWSTTRSPRASSTCPTRWPISRSAASDAPTRSRPPCSGCAARAQASSSASRSPSTAATPRTDFAVPGRRASRPRSSMAAAWAGRAPAWTQATTAIRPAASFGPTTGASCAAPPDRARWPSSHGQRGAASGSAPRMASDIGALVAGLAVEDKARLAGGRDAFS